MLYPLSHERWNPLLYTNCRLREKGLLVLVELKIEN